MEIGTKPTPISVLTAVTNSALNAASEFPSRRIEISDSRTVCTEKLDSDVLVMKPAGRAEHRRNNRFGNGLRGDRPRAIAMLGGRAPTPRA